MIIYIPLRNLYQIIYLILMKKINNKCFKKHETITLSLSWGYIWSTEKMCVQKCYWKRRGSMKGVKGKREALLIPRKGILRSWGAMKGSIQRQCMEKRVYSRDIVRPMEKERSLLKRSGCNENERDLRKIGGVVKKRGLPKEGRFLWQKRGLRKKKW